MTDVGTGRATYFGRRLLNTIRAVLLMVALTMQFGVYGHLLFTAWPSGTADVIVFATLALLGMSIAAGFVTRRRAPVAARWAGVAVLLACSFVTATSLPPDPVHLAERWSFSVIGWYALALLFGVALRWFAGFCVVHVLISVGSALSASASARDMAAMAVVVVAVVGFQIGVALSIRLVWMIAGAAGRASGEEERLRIERVETAAAAGHRERLYAGLCSTTLPLLTGLADGALDPGDPWVRRRCAVEASRLRRLFSEADAVDDRLLHELCAAVDIADRHGTTVHLSARGTPVALPPRVRRELLAPIADTLATTSSEVRLTVLYERGRVTLSLFCAAPEMPITPSGDEIDYTSSVVEGRLWLTTSWRSP